MRGAIPVVLVFEDALSESVLLRLLEHSARPFVVDRSIYSHGNSQFPSKIPVYKLACKSVPHIVFTDLDRVECAPRLLSKWGVGELPREMLLRVAVRETEAWLLADRKGIAHFFGVPANKVPQSPDELDDPKKSLLSVARGSKRRRLAEEILPPHGSRVSIGPLYNQRLCGFVREQWNVDEAGAASPSLLRAIVRIADFMS
jgi:hypothetical protein